MCHRCESHSDVGTGFSCFIFRKSSKQFPRRSWPVRTTASCWILWTARGRTSWGRRSCARVSAVSSSILVRTSTHMTPADQPRSQRPWERGCPADPSRPFGPWWFAVKQPARLASPPLSSPQFPNSLPRKLNPNMHVDDTASSLLSLYPPTHPHPLPPTKVPSYILVMSLSLCTSISVSHVVFLFLTKPSLCIALSCTGCSFQIQTWVLGTFWGWGGTMPLCPGWSNNRCNNGNRTEWRLVWSVIIRVITIC